MKIFLLMTCSFILVLTLCGCSKDTVSNVDISNDEPQTPPSSELLEPNEDEPMPDSSLDEPITFDFAELPEEEYPRGLWTINQLIDKYGAYKELKSFYVQAHRIVNVSVAFEGIDIFFVNKDATNFSFFYESLESGDYEMGNSDKDLELEIHGLDILGSEYVFPHGIGIGKSSKSDVLNAYPKGSAYVVTSITEGDSYNLVIYNYVFYDEDGNKIDGYDSRTGSIEYTFDENEVLNEVRIMWWPGD